MIEDEITDLAARLFRGGGNPSQEKVETQPASVPDKKPITVKVGRETKGRRGKGVTTIFDVPLDEPGLLDLAAKLKQRCGTGGTVKDGRIEIQGDQRERLVVELEKLGYKVRRVGGSPIARGRPTKLTPEIVEKVKAHLPICFYIETKQWPRQHSNRRPNRKR